VHKVETTDEMIQEVESTLVADGTLRNNDVIVIISGAPMRVPSRPHPARVSADGIIDDHHDIHHGGLTWATRRCGTR
jgi:hypothetical protein